jgi:hypothetical protein
MSDMSCAECQDLEVEFALNTLCGEDRARVVDHLDRCPRCRATVSALTESSDRLRELMPELAPPPGFEQRVLAGLGQRASPDRGRQWTVLAAAALVVIALLSGGWLLVRQVPGPADDEDDTLAGTRTVMYSPLIGEHGQLGQVYLDPDQHAWMYLSTTAGPNPIAVRCVALKTDRRVEPLGTYPLVNGQGGWQLPRAVPQGAVVEATVYDARGKPLGTARFGPDRPN